MARATKETVGLYALEIVSKVWFFSHATLLVFLFPWTLFAQTPAQQDSRLSAVLLPLISQHAGDVSVAIKNLDTGQRFEHEANRVMPTASLIKLPLMITAYRAIDDDMLDPSTMVTLGADDKVPGSGVLTEHFSAGAALPLRDYLRLMIRYSDNTATNMVADQVGLSSVADTMESLGFPNTKLHSKVYRGDTSVFPGRSKEYGLGSSTAHEMIGLLELLHFGKLASEASTTAMLDHLQACDDSTKLARFLAPSVKIAHKTGAIANCRTDAGIIFAEKGPIAVCVLTNNNEDQSWSQDNAAHLLCAEVGRAVAERFGSPAASSELKEGAFGKLVEALQRTLNQRLDPSPDLAIDGDFGPATRGAVERFQREHQIAGTGVVTLETWRALGTLIEQADPVPDPHVTNRQTLPLAPQSDPNGPPIVTCKAWLIGNRRTGEVVSESESELSLEPASTTKIMTAYLVLRLAESDAGILHEVVTFSQRADDTPGSTAGLRVGERVTVRELLYGLLLPSGNDASVAFAEHFGARLLKKDDQTVDASYDLFVLAMNEAAKQLGMEQTHYKNPNGLSDEAHVTSAADLFRLTAAVMDNELFRKIVSTRQFGCVVAGEQGYRRNVRWENTNQLLGIEGYKGVKTGTTKAAGACLVSCGERSGDELVVVTLGSSSSPARYADTRNLFRWAWMQRLSTAAATD